MEFDQACKKLQDSVGSHLADLQRQHKQLAGKCEQQTREIQNLQSENRRLKEENARLQVAQPNTDAREGAGTIEPAYGSSTSGEDPFRLERVIQIHDAPVHSVTMRIPESGHQNQHEHPEIATASWDATVKLYNLASEEVVKVLGTQEDSKMGGLYSVAFAKTAPNILGCTSCDKTVYLWDHKEGTMKTKLVGHQDEVNGIDFHSSQQVMCTASDDCKVIIWDFQEGITLRTLDKHTKAVYGACFLGQENQYFVGTCCFDQKTRIFDMRDKQVVALLQTHTDDVIGIDYTKDKLATGSDDGLICIWDTRNFKLMHKIDTKSEPGAIAENEVKRVQFSPDGKRLAAACSSGRVLVYDVESQPQPNRIADLSGHTDCVFDVAWGVNKQTNKQILVSASHDHTLRYWREF